MKVTILDNKTELLHVAFGITEQRVKYLSKIVSDYMNTDKSTAKTLLLLSEIIENANEFAFMCLWRVFDYFSFLPTEQINEFMNGVDKIKNENLISK